MVPQTYFDWNKGVWKIEVEPKIKLFLWKVFQGALPVGERLQARNIATDPKCKRCGLTESINHLFFQCEFAQKVWNFAPFSSTFDSSGLIDLAVNWEDLMSLICLPPTGFPSEGLFPWIMWSLWTARNNLLFNKKNYSPEDVVSKAVYLAREWQGAQEPNTPSKRLKPATESNLENACTVHTDAAWREDVGVAGLGWIINKSAMRSTYGSHCRYVSSPLVAEALAL